MSKNRIYIKEESQSFRSYWADVTERVKAIIGPDVKAAYMKVFECDPKDEPDAKATARQELERYLDRYKDMDSLSCDAATITVVMKNGHVFRFVNSEWGYLEKTDPPEFE
ncbi:MAG: hypothetical protein HDQ88_08840 [Clostridia bacterium]|nr:hypothetical protein [Clostridia bacterium]